MKKSGSSPKVRFWRHAEDAMHVKIQTVRYRTWEMRDGEETKESGWIRRKQKSRATESVAISLFDEEGSRMASRAISTR